MRWGGDGEVLRLTLDVSITRFHRYAIEVILEMRVSKSKRIMAKLQKTRRAEARNT